jgi:hypothetical protein
MEVMVAVQVKTEHKGMEAVEVLVVNLSNIPRQIRITISIEKENAKLRILKSNIKIQPVKMVQTVLMVTLVMQECFQEKKDALVHMNSLWSILVVQLNT